MADLSTKTARKNLATRREPHWMRLSKGHYLGFRKGPDTWVARYSDRDYKQHYKALPVVTETGRSEFDVATRLANEWFSSLGTAATRAVTRGTVKEALESYLADLRRSDRDRTANVAEQRFELIVWSDPLADIPLEDLRLEDMEEWRERLRGGRQNRTVNRHVASIKAGLNVSITKGHIGRPESWALKPLPDVVEQTAETTVFVTPDERQKLYDAASPACADFMKGIAYTGGRPGELAEANRGDFDPVAGTLVLKHRKGRPAKVRPRLVELGPNAVGFFKRVSRGKLPTAPLLLDPNGNRWNRHKWADEIQAAIAAHDLDAESRNKLPKGISAYSFRHARIAELLQIAEVDPITVGKQTGTSVAMIEKYYYRFIGSALREKLVLVDSA